MSSIAKGFAALAGQQSIKVLASFGSSAVIARHVPPSEYAIASIGLIIGLLAGSLKDAGLSSAMLRENSFRPDLSSLLWRVNLFLGCLLGTIVAVTSPVAAHWFGDKRIISVTLIVAATFPVSAMGLQHRAILRRNHQFTKLATIDSAAQIISSALGITCAMLGAGLWSIPLMLAATEIMTSLGVMHASGWNPGRSESLKSATPTLRLGMQLQIASLAQWIPQCDRLILGKAIDLHQLGLFTRFQDLLSTIRMILTTPLLTIATPVLAKSRETKEHYTQSAGNLALVSGLASVTGALMLYAIGDQVLYILLGPSWIGESSFFRISALNLSTVPLTILLFSHATVTGNGRTAIYLSLSGGAIYLGTIMITARYGLDYIAWSCLGANLFIRLPLTVAIAKKTMGEIPKSWLKLELAGTSSCIAIVIIDTALRAYFSTGTNPLSTANLIVAAFSASLILMAFIVVLRKTKTLSLYRRMRQ